MTTITRQDKNCPAVFYEQDADEFFKEMAEEQVYICPFGIGDRKQLNELLDAWVENGHISRENADKYAASVDDSRFPLTGGFHIPSGHTKGFVMVRTGAISVEDRGWVWHKQQEDARENDVAKKQRDELRDIVRQTLRAIDALYTVAAPSAIVKELTPDRTCIGVPIGKIVAEARAAIGEDRE